MHLQKYINKEPHLKALSHDASSPLILAQKQFYY
jgi:hypothetical protein